MLAGTGSMSNATTCILYMYYMYMYVHVCTQCYEYTHIDQQVISKDTTTLMQCIVYNRCALNRKYSPYVHVYTYGTCMNIITCKACGILRG